MAIGNLSNKVSGDDVARVKGIRNPPEYESGFEPTSGGDDFSDLFGDSGGDGDISFDNLLDGDFGESSDSSGGLDDLFGSSDRTGGLLVGGESKPAEVKPDTLDKVMDASGEALMGIGSILAEMYKSIKNRSADDFAYYSRNIIITGGVSAGIGLVLGVIGTITGVRFISFGGISGQMLGCGILTSATGLVGIGLSAMSILKTRGGCQDTEVSDLSDISEIETNDMTEDYEENVGGILDDLFGDDSDSLFGDEEEEEEEEVFKTSFDDIKYTKEELDYNDIVENVRENSYISRESLFNTFKCFFPLNTPNFADKISLSEDNEDFQTIETICLKALSNVAKCEMEDVKSNLESLNETYFSYELRLKRIRGINKVEDIARELEAYFRESSSDTTVNATVDIEGDFYRAIVTKGVTAVVTFGDMFKQSYVTDFFLNTKNKLPFVAGISELGEVILEDAKLYDTMMIAGKPRSGKSWYVQSILAALMLFNSPEDVQFIIVDPKESNLFKTMSLMPHVCGLHDDSNILEVMRDIIDNEGARRKKLLSDNRCDNIWELRDKGINIPVIYLVIDEIITVKNNLGPLDKEFDSLMQVIISQLPSQGIRLLFVPHRATGIVNKTNRTMLSYKVAVKSDIEDIKDTLGVAKWTRSLVNAGDMGLKISNRQDAFYARGSALTTTDADNRSLLISAAKAFYKMGVELPDMSTMGIAANRDEDNIREELSSDGKELQYDALNLLKDLN